MTDIERSHELDQNGTTRIRDVVAFGVFSALTAVASFIGSKVVRERPWKLWYSVLRKPPQTPPNWVFGVVWPVLYGLTAYSGYRAWQRRDEPGAKLALGLWAVQLIPNAAWTPLFFGQHRARLALVDVGLNFVGVAAYTARVASVDRTAAILMTPQLAWLGFASTINSGIVSRNPRWLAG